MITYPTTLDSLPNPTNTDLMENATTTLDHDQQHSNANDAIEALEAKVGINGSAVTTSHDYKLSAVTGSAKALTAGTSTQSVTNLTLVTPTLTLNSDATGDLYYRNSGGALTRLPIGTAGQILDVSSGGIPEWVANPAVADASATVKGVVEIATTAEITAGTSTGATGAKLVVPADAVGSVGASKIVQFNSSTQYPAADGSLITNIVASSPSKIATSAATTTITASGESTVVSATVPANTLGTANAVRVRGYFKISNASSDAAQFKCKYGSTTVVTGASFTPTANDMSGFYEFTLYANASTSAQYGAFVQVLDYVNSQISTEPNNSHQIATGTATETSTGDLTISITITHSSTNLTSTFYGATVERIY